MKLAVALISSSVLLNTVTDRVHLQFRMPCGTSGTTGDSTEGGLLGCLSFIGGGAFNKTCSDFSSIVGGDSNTIFGAGSVIGGGGTNTIFSKNSGIFSGSTNCIDTDSDFSFIGGGATNYINCTAINSFIGGGQSNTIEKTATYNSIVGGKENAIAENRCFSSVLGGTNNAVNGNYSAILGGSNNTVPSGCCYIGIFGCNVTGVTNCAFHANNFVAQNMPTFASGPSGSFYKTTISGVCVVAIVP